MLVISYAYVFMWHTLMWLCCSPLSQVALDYIGKRGATVGVTREKRIKYVLCRKFSWVMKCLM